MPRRSKLKAKRKCAACARPLLVPDLTQQVSMETSWRRMFDQMPAPNGRALICDSCHNRLQMIKAGHV